MEAMEVPPWRWGELFDPAVVRAVLDVADAANDQALALALAHMIEQRATTTVERLDRDAAEVHTRRHAAAQGLSRAADAYVDQVVRLYAHEALQFACLTARLVAQLEAGRQAATLTVDDLSDLRPSALYADWALLPAPPVNIDDDDDEFVEVDDLSLSRTYAKILDALQVGRQESANPRDGLDLGIAHDSTIDVWAMGGVDLARALHQYGNLCLWRLARVGSS